MIPFLVFAQSAPFQWSHDTLSWEGREILSVEGPWPHAEPSVQREPAEPVYLGYPHGPKTAEFVPHGELRETYTIETGTLKGSIRCSGDSFVCSDDPKAPLGSTVGRVSVDGANGVYDRAGDWLITFEGSAVTIRPNAKKGFDVGTSGPCVIRFRPNYYRDHLGYFLWDKKKPLWTKPVAGWCSWMAYLQDVKEEDVLGAARFFAANLKDYGYDVIQIDDGYQRVKQFGQEHSGSEKFSDYWTKPNEKFPHGMEWLAHEIKALGLIPGIWVGYYLPLGLEHAEGYVKDPDGKPHKGPWVNYAVNGLDPAARDEAYTDTIREFKRQGWDYFKIDTLRHILYDSYRQVPDYWKARHESMEQAYRAIMAATKKATGNSYVLACWGTLPELAGLPDGARIGEDVGPDFDSMRRSAKYIAQFQYLNNVVWHNDPDYMCFRVPIDQARAWATMAFLGGGHIMVSDPVADYDAAHLDALRRVGPPIYSRPLNVVPHAPDPEFMTLDAEKGGEQWKVIARFAWRDLPPSDPPETLFRLRKRYLAFDFWDEKFLGVVEQPSFHALPKGNCQVICLRPAEDHPQVLGTNRHLGQGVVELDGVRWDGHTLSGRFKRGSGQAWSLYIHVPKGSKMTSASAPSTIDGEVLKLTFPIGSGWIDWKAEFSPT
ncbi:MAG TPA: hypothetical protein VHE55_15290 [Fimbriimonadaceae bacterium]|nr:hypothetical protein [Fimbriimonadaceae bacterium]